MKKAVIIMLSLGLVLAWGSTSFAGPKALMETLCTRCHKLKRPFTKKKTRAQWEATVNRMAGRSPQITAANKAEIIDFLSKVRDVDAPVQTAKDAAKLTEKEKLHIPSINAPRKVAARSKAKIRVQIGKAPHPMNKEHYIYAVDLYVNNRWEDMVELEPGQEPGVEFLPTMYKTFPIEIVSHCNVDGHWSAKTEIKAE